MTQFKNITIKAKYKQQKLLKNKKREQYNNKKA